MDTRPAMLLVNYATPHGRVSFQLERSALTSSRNLVLVLHEPFPENRVPSTWDSSPGLIDVAYAHCPEQDRVVDSVDVTRMASAVKEAIAAGLGSRRMVVMGESTMAVVALAVGDGALDSVKGVVAWDPPLNTAGSFAYTTNWLADRWATSRLFGVLRDMMGQKNDRLVGAKLTRKVLRESCAPALVLIREQVDAHACELDEVLAAIESTSPDAGTRPDGLLENVIWHHLERMDLTSFYEPSIHSRGRVEAFIEAVFDLSEDGSAIEANGAKQTA